MLKVVHGGLNNSQSRSGSLWAGDLSRWGILPISVILQTGIGIWLAVGWLIFPDFNCVFIPVKHARVLGWHTRHGHLQARCLTRGHWLAWYINCMYNSSIMKDAESGNIMHGHCE